MTNQEIGKRLSIIEDNDGDKENPAIYYVQVYADEDQQIELDYFCIRKNDLNNPKNYDEAEKFAINKARECLSMWIEE